MAGTSVAPEIVRVFVSYSFADAKTAGEVVRLLREGISEVEIATPDSFVKPGSDWSRSVRSALHDCNVVVLILSDQSVRTANMEFELGAAWGLGKRIFAITTHENLVFPVAPAGVRYCSLAELRKSPRRFGTLLRKAVAA